MSASWGMFQIMGFNYAMCGCKTVSDFVIKMSNSQQDQFELAVVFFEKSGCLSALRGKNWASFAKKYNGSAYAQNKYDTKLATAYEKAKKDGYTL
jgi:predicted chitinase